MMPVAESTKFNGLAGACPPPLRGTPVFLMTNTLETGGIERQFTILAHAFRDHGMHIELGCIERRGPLVNAVPPLPAFPVYGSLYSTRSWGARIALARHLRQRGVRVAQAFDFYTNVLMAPVARMAGIPVVLTSHQQIGDLLTPMKFRVQLAAFHFSDCVLCNSQAAADSLIAAGISKRKLRILPNVIPDSFFLPSAPILPRIGGKVRIGMVARMNDPVKRHDFLLNIVAEALQKVPHLELVLAGDGPLRAGLEQRARGLGVDKQVIFLGDQSDIRAVLASLDLSVLTSASESRSNAILEAMASALPVVASDIPGNREIIAHGETGFLVAADDLAGWVQTLEQLATSGELRARVGASARASVESRFRLPAIRDLHEELYCEFLRKKGQLPPGDR